MGVWVEGVMGTNEYQTFRPFPVAGDKRNPH
jgi:hypothetical protein